MQRSNIFAHIELTKFVAGLKLDLEDCRSSLISQHAYFLLIPSKMLSDHLSSEWEDVCNQVSHLGPATNDQGLTIANAVKNTLAQIPKEECVQIAERVIKLQKRVAAEFNY